MAIISTYDGPASINDYQEDYGGFGVIHVTAIFNVHIEIYDEVDAHGAIGLLRCWFNEGTGAVGYMTPGPDTGSGGGFWNAFGLMWGDGSFTPQYAYLADASDDSPPFRDQQLHAATSDYFFILKFNDSDGTVDKEQPTGKSFQRYIYPSELDSHGNLPELILVRLFSRSYDWQHTLDARVEQVGVITSAAMGIDWKYYPMARKLSGAWESCNRDYGTAASSRSAYLRRRESGAWDEVLNNLQNANDQTCWVKSNSVWKNSLPYGNNA